MSLTQRKVFRQKNFEGNIKLSTIVATPEPPPESRVTGIDSSDSDVGIDHLENEQHFFKEKL